MKKWLPFEEAREIVRSNGIRTKEEYLKFINEQRSSVVLFPYHPYRAYKGNWISWQDWTGKKRTIIRNNVFWSFNEAREYVRKLGIKSQKEWGIRCKALPLFIPRTPNQVYKEEWVGLGDWLGTSNTRGCSKKYHVNGGFFKTWSHDMAYILGFWFADGCIRYKKCGSKIFSITQHKDDIYILEEILKKMDSNHPLVKTRNCFDIFIGSKEIFNDILLLGGKPRKSMDVEFPNVPKIYLPDFIRGYFDGDGCVYKHYKSYNSNFVCGSLKFLEKLNEILGEELLSHTSKISYSGSITTIKERIALINKKYWIFKENYRLNLSANSTRMLRDFMYNYPNCMKLKRKYDKFMLAGKIKQNGGRKIGSKNKLHKEKV